MSSIDIEAAIASHVSWVERLRNVIGGQPDSSVTRESAGNDASCGLGQWLYGSGQEYDLFSQFHDLKTVHSRFHQIAAEIVDLVHSQETAAATSLLEDSLRTKSEEIVRLLGDLKIDGY